MKKYFKNLYTNIKYKKQYVNLLISYIIVMSAVMVINLIGHLVISEVTRRETYQSNSRLVKQIQTMCDASFDDALLAAGRMINTDSVTVLSDMTEYSDSQYNSHVKNVIKELEIVVNSNKMITQGYVAFKDSNICISSNAMLNKQILYETAFSDYFELVSSGAKDFSKDGKSYLLTKEESQSFSGAYVHYIEKSVYSNTINLINRIILSLCCGGTSR